MMDLQGNLFHWAAAQPALTGTLIFCLGLVYAFAGFRLFRFLLSVTCAGLGWLVFVVGAEMTHLMPDLVGVSGLLGAGIGVATSIYREKPALFATAVATWGALAWYLAVQLGLPQMIVFVFGGIGAGLGGVFSLLAYRGMRVVLSTLQGAVLLVVGWVSLTSAIAPSIGGTFRQWAAGQSLLVPGFLVMLFITGYSFQAMRERGDIKSGA